MYSVFMQKFMLSMKVQRQFHWSIQHDALLLLYSRSFVAIIFIATVLQQAREGTCESQSTSPDLALISISIPFHCMKGHARGRAAVKANAPQGAEFKCAHCNATRSLVRVVPWTVIANTPQKLEPPVQIPGASSPYRSLDVQTCLLGSFANTMLVP